MTETTLISWPHGIQTFTAASGAASDAIPPPTESTLFNIFSGELSAQIPPSAVTSHTSKYSFSASSPTSSPHGTRTLTAAIVRSDRVSIPDTDCFSNFLVRKVVCLG
ncbi:hypothetical protein O6P43_006569 [Quillaja saponaria]|uniref:Uncharacterized protein n=1 Tax=Quillaja saponaria TaxID=32244 RepID=A0AAD7Q8G1_QUISA|nr:hypothetical protein O6P43_006569 [Quillaja saponaria]